MFNSQPAAPVTPVAPVEEDVALTIRGLVRIYSSLVTIADLPLDIPTGSLYGIVGPDGTGKTTTLTMATDLLTPDRGIAYAHGVDMQARTQETRTLLGAVPNRMRLLDRLSGPDFLVHVDILHGLNTSVACEHAYELLAALDLAETGGKLISGYPASMTKRAALVAALIHSPWILVFDEPFEAADPVSATNTRQVLTDCTRHSDIIILSSHMMVIIQQLYMHMAITDKGRVLISETTDEVAQGGDLGGHFISLIDGVYSEEGLSWLGN